jgi:tRNA A-37 threonylcarbamoyl transferase component Bud32
MSDVSRDLDQTEHLDGISARFESAWQEALRGGPRPDPDTYLSDAPAEERDALRDRLTSLDEDYRRRADEAAAQSATLTWQDAVARSPATLAAPVRPTVGPPPAGSADATTDGPGAPPTGVPPPSAANWPHVPGYEIDGELGRGGMGVVYKARQTDLRRSVALKMILAGAHASDRQLARFRAEARAEARLQHPNIVQVYEIGEHDGLPYFSLEFVDGSNLGQKAGRQPQPPRDAARLVETLARAAHYAHERGVVHRDLKPANVLLTADGTPKVADFGLAKCLDDEDGSTRTGSVLGTPSYMAPEQALGRHRDVGRATDVYALGAILYELLVGRPPFLAATMLDTVEQVRTEEPLPPTRLQPKLPRDLETICLKCLQKDARKRYASAEELAEDLRRFLAGEPIKARPVGAAGRLWRWCRRNPRVAGLSAAVALLLLTVTAGALVFAYQIDRKQRETEQARADAVAASAVAEQNAERAQAESRRADDNARQAVARYNLALDALNVVVGKVQTELEKTPATERMRQKILLAAMDVLRKSADQGDRSGLSERGLASAHMIMGNILLETGKREEAVKEFATCHRILTELYRANPDSDKAVGNYAASLCVQGDRDADYRHDLPGARARYREALALQEDLLAHPKPNPELTPTEIKASTANSYQRLAEIAEQMGPEAQDDPDEMLQKALKVREEVAAANRGPADRKELGHVHYLLGERQWKRHQEAEAVKHYDAALVQCVAAVREDPDSVRAKAELFNLCGKAGDEIFLSGDTARAKTFYAASIGPAEQLAAGDLRIGTHRILAMNYYRMATACLRLGETAASDGYYAKCLAVRERVYVADPKDDRNVIDLMIARARCGQHEQAAALAADLQARKPKNAATLLQVGCCYALCMAAVAHGKSPDQVTADDRARQERYAGLAVAALRAARANGYNKVHDLQVEPDLDPIRADSGFDSFMQEFRKP